MSRFVFQLPDIGEGIAEAEIVAWHVKLGDRVAEDQSLVDVMTDKATVEMTSPVDRACRWRCMARSAQMIAVGSPLVEFGGRRARTPRTATAGADAVAAAARCEPSGESTPAPVQFPNPPPVAVARERGRARLAGHAAAGPRARHRLQSSPAPALAGAS